MNIPENYKIYQTPTEDCPIYDRNKPDWRWRVTSDENDYRKKQAEKESRKEKVSIGNICKYAQDFLNEIDVKSELIFIKGLDITLSINYELIKRQYNLSSQKDIIWLRFTQDGYLGVVASSNDINFDDSTNSSKIIKHLGKMWDSEIVIIFPLPNINGYNDGVLIEGMLGNYLLDKGIPILDRYSHMAELSRKDIAR